MSNVDPDSIKVALNFGLSVLEESDKSEVFVYLMADHSYDIGEVTREVIKTLGEPSYIKSDPNISGYYQYGSPQYCNKVLYVYFLYKYQASREALLGLYHPIDSIFYVGCHPDEEVPASYLPVLKLA